MAAPEWFVDRMQTLQVVKGRSRSTNELAEWASSIDSKTAPSRPTIGRWLSGETLPPTFEPLEVLVTAVLEKAYPKLSDKRLQTELDRWKVWWGQARDAVGRGEPGVSRARPDVYQGLRPFGRPDATRFFGRDATIKDLLQRVDGQLNDTPGPLVILGPSGVGKTSLLAAGLLPAIEKEGLPSAPQAASWPSVMMTPGPDPLAALSAAIPELNEVLDKPDRNEALVRAAISRHVAKSSSSKTLIIVVDQFEEIFQTTANTQQRFVEMLSDAATSNDPDTPAAALVLLACRWDFYPNLNRLRPLKTALQQPFNLQPLTAHELVDAIKKPARRVGISVAPELITRLLDDSGVSAGGSIEGKLPLISHVLQVMQESGPMTVAAYERAGRLTGAISATADAAWQQIQQAGLSEVAMTLLIQLVHVGDNAAHDTRRRVPRTDLLGEPPSDRASRALAILAGPTARLIAGGDVTGGSESGPDDQRDTGSEITITHEALIREWPLLSDAVDDERSDLMARQDIERDARRWLAAHQPADRLPRGSVLAEARRVAEKYSSMGDLTREFLERATNAEQQIRQRKRLAKIGRNLAVVVLVLIGAIGWGAWRWVDHINNVVTFTQVKAVADQLRSSDASAAAQLYLYAYRLQATPALYTDLLASETVPLSTPLHARDAIARAVAFNRDGSAAIIGSADGTVQLWDVRDRGQLRPWGPPLPSTGHDTKTVGITPDGHTVIAGDGDGQIRMWDVTDLAHPVALGPPRPGITSPAATHNRFAGVLCLAITPDGHQLLFGGGDGSIYRWDITNPREPRPTGPPLPGPRAVTSLSIDADGHHLAVGRTDHTVTVVDLQDPNRISLESPPTVVSNKAVYALAFNPTSSVLATAGADQLVRLWDTTDPRHLTPVGSPLPGNTNAIYGLAFSPDGLTLASGGADNTVRMWDVADPAHTVSLGPALGGHTRGVASLAFSPDGKDLISGGADNTVRVWTLPQMLVGHRGSISGLTLTRDGDTLVSGGQDGTARIWDIRDGAAAAAPNSPTPANPSGVIAVAVTPDGAMMATGGVDGTLQLWDIRNHTHHTPLGPPLNTGGKAIYGLSFSADGQVLVSAGADNLVHLWRIGPNGPTRAAAFSPDGRNHAPVDGPGGVGAVQFWPTGRVLAAGAQDNTVRLWDLADPQQPRQLGRTAPHSAFVKTIAISPDGATLAEGSADHTITLTDVRDPAQAKPWGPAVAKHQNPVTSLAFDSSGHTMLSGGDDGKVMLWDVRDPAHFSPIGEPLRLSADPIRALAVSPQRQLVTSAGRDAIVRLWSIDVYQAIDRICQATPQAITPTTWAEYVPSRDFDPPCP